MRWEIANTAQYSVTTFILDLRRSWQPSNIDILVKTLTSSFASKRRQLCKILYKALLSDTDAKEMAWKLNKSEIFHPKSFAIRVHSGSFQSASLLSHGWDRVVQNWEKSTPTSPSPSPIVWISLDLFDIEITSTPAVPTSFCLSFEMVAKVERISIHGLSIETSMDQWIQENSWCSRLLSRWCYLVSLISSWYARYTHLGHNFIHAGYPSRCLNVISSTVRTNCKIWFAISHFLATQVCIELRLWSQRRSMSTLSENIA